MPFMIAPMPCSRTPTWTFRPAGVFGVNTPAPSKVINVFVDGFRSAEPPTTQGTFFAMALSTLPELSRVASPFASAGNTSGCPCPTLPGNLAGFHRFEFTGFLRELRLVVREELRPRGVRLLALREVADAGLEVDRTRRPGTRNEESSGQP